MLPIIASAYARHEKLYSNFIYIRVRSFGPASSPIRSNGWPSSRKRSAIVSGALSTIVSPRFVGVHVDPYEGRILGVELDRGKMSFSYFGAMANALHFGDFGKLYSKTIWFVFGAIMTALAVTGTVVFWKRNVRRLAAPDPSFARRVWHLFRPWGGAMGMLKPVNYLILAFAIVASVMTIRFYSTGTAAMAAHYPAQAVGSWQLGSGLID